MAMGDEGHPWWAFRQQALRVASAADSACCGGDRPSDPHVSRPLSGRPAVRGAARRPTPRQTAGRPAEVTGA